MLTDPAGRHVVEVTGPVAADAGQQAQLADLGLSAAEAAASRLTSINGMTQTLPSDGRRVTLAKRDVDPLGRPVPVLHLGATERDHAAIRQLREACTGVAAAIAAPGAMLFQTQQAAPTRRLFHEAGTCAMGTGPEACCDPSGRLRALTNVWVADASVFPSAGDRHPTLTVLAHASRVARDIVRHFGQPARRSHF